MKKALGLGVLGIWVFVSLASSASAACTGDCNGDGAVRVSELVRGVNIALGSQPVDACPSFDLNGNGLVAVNELVSAVNAALRGCPSGIEEALEILASGDILRASQRLSELASEDPSDARTQVYQMFAQLVVDAVDNQVLRGLASDSGVDLVGDASDICELALLNFPSGRLEPPPGDAPSSGEILVALRNEVLPIVDGAIEALKALPSGVAIEVRAEDLPSCIRSAVAGLSFEVDDGDLILFRAALEGLGSLLDVLNGYDLDAPLVDLLVGDLTTVVEESVSFLTLQDPSLMTSGGTRFDASLASVLEAIASILGELDDQSADFLVIASEDLAGLERTRDILLLVRSSLSGSVTLLPEHGLDTPQRLDLSEFFGGGLTSLRQFLPRHPVSSEVRFSHEFPDPTFGGVAADLSSAAICSYLAAAGIFCADVLETTDGADNPLDVSCGETLARTIAPADDVDWMRVTLDRRQEVVFSMNVDDFASLVLRDSQGTVINSARTFAPFIRVVLDAGAYVVEASSFASEFAYELRVDCSATSAPTPTATLVPVTQAPTSTPDFPPTPTPVGGDVPGIIVVGAAGSPGDRVTISAILSAGGEAVAGSQNDIGLDPRFFSIPSALRCSNRFNQPCANDSDCSPFESCEPAPDCTANPAIGREETLGAHQPPGCAPGSCSGMRALVLSFVNTDSIADGAMLYTCPVDIAANTPEGEYVLATSNVGLSTAEGDSICQGGTCLARDGVLVVGDPSSIPTPTPFPGATATPSPTIIVGPSFGELSPCVVEDEWAFDVSSGDDVSVTVDTTDLASASDLCFDIHCPGTSAYPDDSFRCTFGPDSPSLSCPRVDFVAGESGQCRVVVKNCGIDTFDQCGVARYSITASSNGGAVSETLVADDVGLGATCGNGMLDDGEQCDDGNDVGEDACSRICETTTGDDPEMTIGAFVGTANTVVPLDFALRTHGLLVAGIEFGFELASGAAVMANDNGDPDCRANPMTRKGGFFRFGDPGCESQGNCTGAFSLVLSFKSLRAIRDESVLFTCNIQVGPQALDRSSVLESCSRLGASDPVGNAIPLRCADDVTAAAFGATASELADESAQSSSEVTRLVRAVARGVPVTFDLGSD